jgi:hypothetical protein
MLWPKQGRKTRNTKGMGALKGQIPCPKCDTLHCYVPILLSRIYGIHTHEEYLRAHRKLFSMSCRRQTSSLCTLSMHVQLCSAIKKPTVQQITYKTHSDHIKCQKCSLLLHLHSLNLHKIHMLKFLFRN